MTTETPVLIRDDQLTHVTGARTLHTAKLRKAKRGGQLVTVHVETRSETWVFRPAGEVVEPFFQNDRTIGDLAEEQRKFLEGIGDDFVDID